MLCSLLNVDCYTQSKNELTFAAEGSSREKILYKMTSSLISLQTTTTFIAQCFLNIVRLIFTNTVLHEST